MIDNIFDTNRFMSALMDNINIPQTNIILE